MCMAQRVAEIFKALGANFTEGTLKVTSPEHGGVIAQLACDAQAGIDAKIAQAAKTQASWAAQPRTVRVALVEAYAAAIKTHRAALAELIMLEAGKTASEAQGEADGSADVLLKTIKDATLPDLGVMQRRKERPPVGVVGLITSFNFPMVVAHWTLAPALLSGNAVVWKPSEKTPLVALACKAVWDGVAGDYKDMLQIIVGARETGEALVAHESVGMISATGSVAMGQGIRKTLAGKKGNVAPPILELGGNNGVIISEKLSPEHLHWSLSALLQSFLGTTGQRCTNTRRLFVHRSLHDEAVRQLDAHIAAFLSSAIKDGAFDPANAYGYRALIDEAAFRQFEEAKAQTRESQGKVLHGRRLFAETSPHAYYVEPALALLPNQAQLMHREIFAPILFIVPYDGGIDNALALLNAPANAGLVGAIYTQNQQEADYFALKNEAAHSLINSPKGTGTPAHGMGFGGNKESGCGEILNSVDPLQAFCRTGNFSRIAQNKDVVMDR